MKYFSFFPPFHLFFAVSLIMYHVFVFQLPNIDWSAYNVKIPVESLKRHTRKVSDRLTDGSLSSATIPEHELGDFKSRILVRGRPFDDSKPETFNQVCTIA
jgi:hypothetical protein